MDHLTSQKKSLRDTLKKLRATIPRAQQQSVACALRQQELPFLLPGDKNIISIYSPKGTELDPRPLSERLANNGHTLCLPVVEANSKIMRFRTYQIGDALINGAYDILEPGPERATCVPQIVLCPLLAADLSGNRLGYGGGYFDQTLNQLRKKGRVLVVGLCYDVQIIERVPVGAHDIKLDYVLSEKRCVKC